MKKRTLKPLRDRKPEVVRTLPQMTKQLSKDTGFTNADIQTVLRAMASYIKDSMEEGVGVSIPKLGIFYPLLKPARTVMSLNGGIGTPTKMKMADRWQMKFKGSETIQSLLAQKVATKEEVDSLYKD